MDMFGTTLAQMRRARRLSQTALSHRSSVSQRHISFLESGRSHPGPETVKKLAAALALDYADTNQIYTAAGFTPPRPEFDFQAAEFAPARQVIMRILTRHEPYPAFVTDRAGYLIQHNDAVGRILRHLAPNQDLWVQTAHQGRANLFDLSFHPKGLAGLMLNPEQVVPHSLRRLDNVAVHSKSAQAVRKRVSTYPVVSRYGRHASGEHTPIISERYRLHDQEVSLTGISSSFGAPEDVSAQNIQIELYFAADDKTHQTLTALR